ncbi:MAG: MBOAT family O-acyltransferase [bacterium]
MVFSSPAFLFLFLPAVLYIYSFLGKRGRNIFLLFVSLLFYAWGEGFFVLLMLASCFFNYYSGLIINAFKRKSMHSHAKWTLSASVTVNLIFLGIYKYSDFFVRSINNVIEALGASPFEEPRIHLPIGISFFTFQAISYVIDIYREKNEPQKDPVKVALFISLFPQLIAGPIVRYHDIARQIVKRSFSTGNVIIGLKRFVFGLAKKVLIADVLSGVSNTVFEMNPEKLGIAPAWFGVVVWGIHLYFDFSGYSDMAIGLARIFGFRLLENFNYPYISRSIREYWTRWHISLSTWLKDYLYIPLGGNRKGKKRTYINLFIVFVLCGLWHGSAWNFVFFGIFQGTVMALERMGLESFIRSLWRPLQHVYFLFILLLSYAVFISKGFSYNLSYFGAMFSGSFYGGISFSELMDSYSAASLAAGLIFSLPVYPFLEKKLKPYFSLSFETRNFGKIATLVNALFFITLFIASAMTVSMRSYDPFVYFRF